MLGYINFVKRVWIVWSYQESLEWIWRYPPADLPPKVLWNSDILLGGVDSSFDSADFLPLKFNRLSPVKSDTHETLEEKKARSQKSKLTPFKF